MSGAAQRVCGLLILALIPAATIAGEAQIRKVLEPKLRGGRIEKVAPSPVQSLYEVQVRTPDGVVILYTDELARHIISGDIFESLSDRNLTEEQRRRLSSIRFDSLPLQHAVKVKRGSGTRALAVFTDPYCPACRQLDEALSRVGDVTIYYFMFPVIRPDLIDQSRAVWCAPDRAKAWRDLSQRGKPPPSRRCADPVDEILQLGRALHITATPTVFFANGERISGGLPVAELRKMLEKADGKDRVQ